MAQPLTTNPSSLDFGMVITTVEDTQSLTLINNTPEQLRIDDLDLPHDAFAILGDTAFLMQPAEQLDVEIIFMPTHNIKHNTELVIKPWHPEGQISIDIRGEGEYAEAYYASTQDLSEEALKQALKTRISAPYTTLGYNAARDAMYMFIDNQKVNGQGASQNTLECVYTGEQAVGYTSRSDAQTSDGFTTEHTFPQSTFGSQDPMQSDLYHLFPAKGYANSERSNKPFAPVSNPSWSVGGSKSNSSLFEPRGEQKGPTARAMLYFLIRYQNHSTFVNASQQQTLKTWNSTFLPSSVEKQRNDDINSYQQNRNPFVDHPEFAERITSFISTSVAPELKALYLGCDTIDLGYVGVGDTQRYKLVLVGTGNTEVALSSESVSGSGLMLENLPAAVQPGEDAAVEVAYVASSASPFIGELTFATDRSASDTVKIPVIANVNPVRVDEAEGLPVHVFPNPTTGVLFVSVKQAMSYTITDVLGRKLRSGRLEAGLNQVELPNISGLMFLYTNGRALPIVKL